MYGLDLGGIPRKTIDGLGEESFTSWHTHSSIPSDVNCSQTGVQEIDSSLKGFL